MCDVIYRKIKLTPVGMSQMLVWDVQVTFLSTVLLFSTLQMEK